MTPIPHRTCCGARATTINEDNRVRCNGWHRKAHSQGTTAQRHRCVLPAANIIPHQPASQPDSLHQPLNAYTSHPLNAYPISAISNADPPVLLLVTSPGNHTVVCVARNPAALDDLAAEVDTTRLTIVKGDLTDAASLQPAFEGADVVVFAAGVASIKQAATQKTTVYSVGEPGGMFAHPCWLQE